MPMVYRHCSICAAHASGVRGFGRREKSSAAVEGPRLFKLKLIGEYSPYEIVLNFLREIGIYGDL